MLRLRRILFPTDFSACAERAFLHAAYLAECAGAELHVLHVVEGEGEAPAGWAAGFRITAEDVAADLRLPLPPQPERKPGYVPIVEAEVRAEAPAPAILRYVEERDVDLVVMGTHGRRGARRLVMGSVAEAVVRAAPCPVFTVRDVDRHDGTTVGRIVAPVDLSERSEDAARHAAALAVTYGAALDLLFVVDTAALPSATVPYLGTFVVPAGDVRRRAEEALERLGAALQGAMPALGTVGTFVRIGAPATVITDLAAANGADLLVLGTHGRTGLNRLLMGSVAEQVIRSAPCPVFTVKSFGRGLLPEAEGEVDPLEAAPLASEAGS